MKVKTTNQIEFRPLRWALLGGPIAEYFFRGTWVPGTHLCSRLQESIHSFDTFSGGNNEHLELEGLTKVLRTQTRVLLPRE